MNTGIRETAYLAGGCFWGMQDLLRSIPGVIKTSTTTRMIRSQGTPKQS
jgi:peptide methionine sulfoxide reductase MsrA